MNKIDLLNRIKEENRERDPYEAEVGKIGWQIGAFATAVIAIVIFTIEALFFGKYNVGILIAPLVMLDINAIIEAVKLKKAFQMVMSVILTVVLVAAVVAYVFCFCYGWV